MTPVVCNCDEHRYVPDEDALACTCPDCGASFVRRGDLWVRCSMVQPLGYALASIGTFCSSICDGSQPISWAHEHHLSSRVNLLRAAERMSRDLDCTVFEVSP